MEQKEKLQEPIQATDANGWMMNDEQTIVKIDQYYIDPRNHIVIHAIDIEAEGDSCYLGWYDCYDNIPLPPRIYPSFEECKKNEEAIRNFEEAKAKAEREAEKNRIFNELEKNYDLYVIEDFLKEMHGRSIRRKEDFSETSYRNAIAVFRKGYIKFDLTKSGTTNIPLENIDHVSEKNGDITITTKEGFEFHIKKEDNLGQYEAIHIMFIEPIYKYL